MMRQALLPRSTVASILLLAGALSSLVAPGCSSSSPAPLLIPDGSTGPSANPTPPGPVDGVDAAPVDAGPLVGLEPPPPVKVDELTEAFGVFVATTGAPDGAGTRAAPLSTMSAGILKAKADKKRLYVCAGTYPEALTLENGVSVLANLDCSAPDWKLGSAHAVLASPTSPALTARNIKLATRVDGLDVIAPAGTEADPSSIALLAVGSAGLTLTEGKLEAQSGFAGKDGTSPPQLTIDRTEFWRDPTGSQPPADCTYELASGASVPCTTTNGFSYPARAGELGGFVRCMSGNVEVTASRGGQGGKSGVYRNGTTLTPPTAGANGSTSTPSGNGTNGASSAGGSFDENGFVLGSGAAGTNGGPGAGGRGGDGSSQLPTFANPTVIRWSANGSAGGAGGCPGMAGTPGTGGGASIGALLLRSPLRLEKMSIRAGMGGAGGRGSVGSTPTAGQVQGLPGTGLPGNAGGVSGVSGHGAGGPSIAVVHDKVAKPTVTTSTLVHGTGGASPAEISEPGVFGGPARVIPAAGKAQEVDTLEL